MSLKKPLTGLGKEAANHPLYYGNRRLVFLRHPDVVRVVEALDEHDSPAGALRACGIDERRWPAFERALTSLHDSEMLCEPDRVAAG